MDGFISIKQFAQKSGVTVRTLHYYDQTGLLKPAGRGENGYRYYCEQDLLRMQQIVTLKLLGLSLQKIKDILNGPDFDLQRSLEIQKEAIEEHIARLQQVVWALRYTQERVKSRGTAELEWPIIAEMIQNVNQENGSLWMKKYYSPETWDKLQGRSKKISPEQIAQYTRLWEDLTHDFKNFSDLQADDPKIQELAERMDELLTQFTQGDARVEQGLDALYADKEAIPTQYQNYDALVSELMGKALTVFRHRKRNN